MPAKNFEHFIEWLTSEMRSRGWGVRETAREAEISHTPISRILNGDRPTFDTCMALSRAFGVPPEEVLRHAGLLPRPPAWSPDMEESAALFAQLSAEDREEILRFMRLKVELHEKRKRERERPKKG